MRRVLVALSIMATAGVGLTAQAPRQPNVVLIITDDVGYGDLGSYGAPDIRTPNLDRLAKIGTRFTDFYANGSSCTPTRAGLISGRYQQRYSLEAPLSAASSPDGQRGLPVTGHSLPQLLKNAGYATALIGKWHLGYLPAFSPKAHGFDAFFGFKGGYVDYYQHTDGFGEPDLFEGDEPTRAAGYMTDLITQRSVKFISDNAARPFFLEVAYSAAHWPYQVPDQPSIARDNARHLLPFDENTATRAAYARMIERADRGVGQIISAVEKLGLASHTLVIFTNDNGGEWLSRNAPLFNRKFTLWEGGIRVPTIVAWPGRIPAGKVSPQVGISMDLTSSIVAAAGAAVPAGVTLDGVNLLPILEGKSPVVERTLFWRVQYPGLAQRAVRSGHWKLLRSGSHVSLFDMRKDLGERDDRAATETALVRKLFLMLQAWEKDVDSEAKARGATSQPR